VRCKFAYDRGKLEQIADGPGFDDEDVVLAVYICHHVCTSWGVGRRHGYNSIIHNRAQGVKVIGLADGDDGVRK
jgi:hypothetical protein